MTMEIGMSTTDTIEKLGKGEFVFNKEPGNSMTPILKSKSFYISNPNFSC